MAFAPPPGNFLPVSLPPTPRTYFGGIQFPTEGSKGKETKRKQKKKRGQLVKIVGFTFPFLINFSDFLEPRLSFLLNYFINIYIKLPIVRLFLLPCLLVTMFTNTMARVLFNT